MGQEFQISGEQLFDEYILVAPGSDYGRAMWSDIEKLHNGMILESALQPVNKVLGFLHHVHFSYAINKRVQLPFQSLWRKIYSPESIRWDEKKKYCLIYTDNSAARTDIKYLTELSQNKNITMILVMVNTMARRTSLIKKRLPAFSQVYSFDKGDCDKYGFIYHPTNYSMVDMIHVDKPITDAFFVGVSKGRASTIGKVYTVLKSENAKSEFYISGIETGEKKIEGIHYNQWLDYAQVLDNIRKSNCIVEIMDRKQDGVTLRTMEAICYNKKLLTNNPSMRESQYYKTGNIQVFDNPDEIDVDFVKNHEKVDYGYEGEFSPVHLIEHINQLELEKQK